jgi:hypothetical protein
MVYSQVANIAVKTEKIRPPKNTAFVAIESLLSLSWFVTEINWACTPQNRIAYIFDSENK